MDDVHAGMKLFTHPCLIDCCTIGRPAWLGILRVWKVGSSVLLIKGSDLTLLIAMVYWCDLLGFLLLAVGGSLDV
jgi:hypothetical protein